MKKYVSILLLTVLGLTAWPVTGDAATGPLQLTTSPLPINLEAKPGETVSTDLRVKSNSGGTVRLKTSLLKFTAFGEEGKPRLMDRQPGDDYFDWVSFDKTEFDAPQDVWQTVKMTIKVPKQGAAFGYYFAPVFTRAGDDKMPDVSANAIQGGTAIMVLLNVKVEGAKRMLQLESFSVQHRVVEFLPSFFDIKFKNTGNVHLVPGGNVFIMRGNKQVGSVLVNEERGNILPNSKRVYHATWEDGYPQFAQASDGGKVKTDRKGEIVYRVDWDVHGKNPLTHIRFGRYTAKLYAIYDDGDRDVPVESTLTFWVIPWRILLGVLLVLLLVGFGVWSFARGVWRGARWFRGGRH